MLPLARDPPTPEIVNDQGPGDEQKQNDSDQQFHTTLEHLAGARHYAAPGVHTLILYADHRMQEGETGGTKEQGPGLPVPG